MICWCAACEARYYAARSAPVRTEQRGPWICGVCGASKWYERQPCECSNGAATPARRDRPMPAGPVLDGDTAVAMIRRRFAAV